MSRRGDPTHGAAPAQQLRAEAGGAEDYGRKDVAITAALRSDREGCCEY